MKQTSKRILSLLLALIMTVGLGATAVLADTPTADSVELNESSMTLYLNKADGATLTARAMPTDYAGEYTWSAKTAGIVDISGSGKTVTITPKKVGTTEVTVTVAGADNKKLTATCSVTVAAAAISSVEITGSGVSDDTVTITEGGSVKLNAAVTMVGGGSSEGVEIDWSVGDTDIAGYSSDGTISYYAPGITTVTATASLKGSASKSDTITVICGAPSGVVIASKGKPANDEVLVGDSFTLTAGTQPDGAFDSKITWSSSDSEKATVSSSGKVTAKKAGNVTITAAALGKTAEYTFTVKNRELTGIELPKTHTMYLGSTSKINVTTVPSDIAEDTFDIKWESEDTTIVIVDPTTGTLSAIKTGTVRITAQAYKKGTNETIGDSVVCVVSVRQPTADINANAKTGTTSSLTTLGVYSSLRSQFKSTIGNGSYPSSSATVTFTSLGSSSAGVLYKSSSTATSNKVAENTAYEISKVGAMYFKPGRAGTTYVLEYTLRDGDLTMTGTININVKSGSKNITITLTGSDSYVFTSDENEEETAAYRLIADEIGTYSYLKFGDTEFGSEDVGKLCPSSTSSTSVEGSSRQFMNSSSGTYTVRKLCFQPTGEGGNYAIEYTAYDSNDEAVAAGLLIIKTPEQESDVTVHLDGTDDYSFTDRTSKDKKSAYTMLENYIDKETDGEGAYIKFTKITEGKAGTLYVDDNAKEEVDTSERYSLKEIKDFYFVPDKSGTWTGEFAIYATASSRTKIGSGTLELALPGSSDEDAVVVHLDDTDSYEFGDKTSKDKKSAYTLIKDYIDDASSKTCSYIRFGDVISGSKVGTLYTTSDTLNSNEVRSTHKFYLDALTSSQLDLAEVCFEPDTKGTFEIEFTAYTSAGVKIADGTLQLVVGSGSASSGDMDIYFNTTTGTSVSFNESAFLEWFKEQTGSSYKLAYVTFDDMSRSGGTFKCGTKSFAPGDEDKFYSSTYAGSKASSAFSLNSVKFTAGKTTGCVEVDFTCYGGTSAASYATKKSGTLCIYITKGTVKDISVSVKSSAAIDLSESAFLNVYKGATSTTSSGSEFYIRLMEIPSKGKLYVNYTSSSKPGTAITSSNLDRYDFHINGGKSDVSADDLTYVPATSASGSVSVHYTAYNEDDEPIYVGTITFGYGAVKTMSCYSDGYTFKAADFYTISDSDPVMALTFKQPASGALFVNYANGSGTAVTANTKLYTAQSSYGTYSISALTYIPKAGATGDVTIEYTALTAYGNTYSGSVTMTVKGKTASSKFKDVTSTGVGTWAADSVDFASAWGLVNGTGTSTFAPNDNMSRAQLVTILYRAAGSPTVTGKCQFTDVPSSQYYYNAVIWASKNGIVTGTSSTTFNPNGNVTREQVATFLYRYAKYKGLNTSVSGSLASYTDYNSVSAYAKDAMTWAVAKGYITSTSTSAKVLTPGGNATRAQVAVMLHRFLTY